MENIILMGVLLAIPLFLRLRKSKPVTQNFNSFRHPFLPMLLAYLGAMGFVLSLTPAMNLALTSQSQSVCLLGFLMGLIYFGFLTNLRGALFANILLPFMALLSIAAMVMGSNTPLYLLGKGFFACCQGGFFVLFPRIIPIFFGESRFKTRYGFLALWVSGFMLSSYYISSKAVLSSQSLGELYITLIILCCIGAFFLLLAWQRRYYLVVDNNR